MLKFEVRMDYLYGYIVSNILYIHTHMKTYKIPC